MTLKHANYISEDECIEVQFSADIDQEGYIDNITILRLIILGEEQDPDDLNHKVIREILNLAEDENLDWYTW